MNNYHISKRKRRAVLFFSYGFMTLATIAITIVCLLIVLGYRFDIKDGSLEQGALVQLRTVPSGATASIDGKIFRSITPTKADVSVGEHTIEYSKNGYVSWKKTFRLEAGELRWLDYARLVPTKIDTRPIAAADGVTSAIVSPDRGYVVTIANQQELSVVIHDIRDTAKISSKTITLPSKFVEPIPGQSLTLHLEEWDVSSRYALLRVDGTSQKHDYVLLDRNASDGAPRNITREFNLPFRAMHISRTSNSVLYALTDSDLRKIDLSSKSISQPLISQVDSYVLGSEETIGFVATRGQQRVTGLYKDNKELPQRNLSLGEPIAIDMADYFYHKYMAVGSRTHVDIIKDPLTNTAHTTLATLSLPSEVIRVEFSDNGRFVIAITPQGFMSYDLETKQLTFVASDVETLRWLDSYYAVDHTAGSLRMFEFDGTNSHVITPSIRTLPAGLSADEKSIISFGLYDGAIKLQTSRLAQP